MRAYKLSLLREIAGYDVDGIELDFLRDNHLFADAHPAARARAPHRRFHRRDVRKVCSMPAAQAAGSSARIPLDAARHAESGIDVRRMFVCGLDICNLSGWYHSTQCTDGLRDVQRQVPGMPTYFELTHCCANHPHFMANNSYGTTGWPRLCDSQIASTARLALEAGAHGICLFNFVYYRHIQGNDLPQGIRTEPPFHMVRHLTDAAWLARQPTGTYLARQTPCTSTSRPGPCSPAPPSASSSSSPRTQGCSRRGCASTASSRSSTARPRRGRWCARGLQRARSWRGERAGASAAGQPLR